MTYKRTIYNLDTFKESIDRVVAQAAITAKEFGLDDGHLFQKDGYNHPSSITNDEHCDSFEAIPNKLIRKTRPMLSAFKALEKELGIDSGVLTRYITRLQPGHFLGWKASPHKCIGKFFAISTTRCHIQFKDEIIVLPPYRAISFDPRDAYTISNAKDMENYIVFMIPDLMLPLEDYEINF